MSSSWVQDESGVLLYATSFNRLIDHNKRLKSEDDSTVPMLFPRSRAYSSPEDKDLCA
jgi:hypothetical protein